MLMPRRSRENGRQNTGLRIWRLWKPRSVVCDSASTPPTTTASAVFVASKRCAQPTAFALAEQAVDTAKHGPPMPVTRRSASSIAPKECWRCRS